MRRVSVGDVKAFEVLPSDPALVRPARPWLLSRLPDGTAEFLLIQITRSSAPPR